MPVSIDPQTGERVKEGESGIDPTSGERISKSSTDESKPKSSNWFGFQDAADADLADMKRHRTPEEMRKTARIPVGKGEVASYVASGVGHASAGILGMVVHPLDSLKGTYETGKEVLSYAAPHNPYDPGELMDKMRADQGPLASQVRDFQETYTRDPKEAIANLSGDLLGMYLSGKLLDAAGKPIKVIGGKGMDTLRATREGMRRIPDTVAGTGPKVTRNLVKETTAKNADIEAGNRQAREVADARNQERAHAHQESTQSALHETEGREIQHAQDTKVAEEANAKATQEHEQAVELTDAANKAKMDEHASKTQSIEEENAAKQSEFEAAKTKAEELEKASKEQETARGKAARTVKEQAARIVQRLKSVQEKWKDSTALQKQKGYQPTGILDKAFDQIRKATAGAQGSSSELAGSVQKALGKIAGSTESIKIFKDILSKNPEDDPEFMTLDEGDGKARIPKGHPLYDILKEGQSEASSPPTWKDLQGYYTELGRSLSNGNLPGDVYQALRSLQDDIASQMQKMADSRGVGARWKQARAQYRDYMQTFREMSGPNHSGSPIAQSLAAKDPAYAVKPLTAEETAQRVRNDLSRFDPPVNGQGGAGKLYDNFRAANREFDSLGKPIKVPETPVAPKPKEMPAAPALQARPEPPKVAAVKPPERVELPNRPPEVTATQDPTKKIGEAEVRYAKEKALDKRVEHVEHRGGWLATWPVLYVLRDIARGEAPNIGAAAAESGATLAAVNAAARILRNPKVVEFLTRATARDIAQIPPDLRGDFPSIIKAAQKQGIEISPALLKAIGATAALPKTQQLQDTRDAQRQATQQ